MGHSPGQGWAPGLTHWHSGAELGANQVEPATPCWLHSTLKGRSSISCSISLYLFPGDREGITKEKRNGDVSEDIKEHCCLPHCVGPDTARWTEYPGNLAVESPSVHEF